MPGPEWRPSSALPSAPDRLRGLLDAHRIITSDLSLSAMLTRIVESACGLVGSRYGALGVRGVDGSLEQFVHHGMDEETVRRIGALPRGEGLLGAVLTEPVPIRIDEIGGDPRSAGFPPHHPPMHAFLGVPIRVRDEAFGALYLAEPEHGTFSAEDEELITALAATAGTAIENARLYEDAQRSKDWLHASGEIARALLADADADMLMEVVSRALHVAEADYGALILPTEDGRLHVTVTVGLGADDFRGLIFEPANSPMGRAIMSGDSLLMTDMTRMANTDFDNRHNYGPMMIAPLVDAGGIRGGVLLMRVADRAPFTARDLDLATTFADQVALALQLNDARADAEYLRILEDRHRIAQELHDNVMQRLFATGMGLQGLAERDLPPELADRLHRHVTDLDETIDEIRDRVFGLRSDAEAAAERSQSRFPRVARRPGATTA